jgi:nucleoid-associated protein YgaU
MKKLILALIASILIVSVAGAQSLQDNEYYRKMVELKRQSETAFEDGDYAEAKRLAEEASGYKELSDQWIATQLAAYRARSALVRLKDMLIRYDRPALREQYPEELTEARALYDQAYAEFYDEEAYETSLATSRRGMNILSAIDYVATGSLPAAYRVRLIPGNRDCLWNIAGYEFVYGDPFSWRLLYEENKEKLPEPDNPHLIHPDMILTIPEREGEHRSGTWIDGEIR